MIVKYMPLVLLAGGVAGCQPYYAAPYPAAYTTQQDGYWVYRPAGSYRTAAPEVMRTEIAVPAYVDRYGRVVAVDYNQGWGPGWGGQGYGRVIVPAPR